MTKIRISFGLALAVSGIVLGQTEPRYLVDILKDEILPPDVANVELRRHILRQIGNLPVTPTATSWTAESKRVRAELLNNVVFHGWPKAWTDGPSKFEDLGVSSHNGYRIRKLRYEIVPGFQSVAILYEPLNMQGKIPAVLNVNGHVGAPGKSIEYKQKRCITLARNGILALNLEWMSYGELDHEWNNHSFGAHLDLVGANELGFFYLAMRRGLDYLYDHPNTDRARIGMTGLSGGGWQTIVLSALDERIKVSVPVAGFSAIRPRVEANDRGSIGDFEQSATDFLKGRDYTYLAAMMAPRPTLLTYNAEDDCCFRAAMVKPLVYDAIRPFFKLYGKEEDFAWHENRDPGTHNYQLDNRTATYEFFSRQFKLPPFKEDLGVAEEVLSPDEMLVGLPSANLTIVGLARKLADSIHRDSLPFDISGREATRDRLKDIVRYQPAQTEGAWTTGVTKHGGVETKSRLFTMADGLSSNGVWLKAIGVPDKSPVTIILADNGKQTTAVEVNDSISRGHQVLALDLPFNGNAWPKDRNWVYQQLVNTTGERPLGLEVSHLIGVANWLKQQAGAGKVRLESSGMRTQVVALVAAAIEPKLFSEVVVRNGISSLRYLIDKPVRFNEAADLFCLDLYKLADLDQLAILAEPAKVKTQLSAIKTLR